jgi:GNAT superfamily N-acetyltransferase
MWRIRPANPEADAISALAIRSKGHWDYTPEQMAVFRTELTLAPDDVVTHRAHVLEEDGRILAFYTLVDAGPHTAELEHIFVDPLHLGQGFGSALFDHACALARSVGFEDLVIQSDPNASGFYAALGARLERIIPSSIPGRSIPYFTYELRNRADPGPKQPA